VSRCFRLSRCFRNYLCVIFAATKKDTCFVPRIIPYEFICPGGVLAVDCLLLATVTALRNCSTFLEQTLIAGRHFYRFRLCCGLYDRGLFPSRCRDFIFGTTSIPAVGSTQACILVPGFFHWEKCGRREKLATRLRLVPRSRMRGTTRPLTPYIFIA